MHSFYQIRYYMVNEKTLSGTGCQAPNANGDMGDQPKEMASRRRGRGEERRDAHPEKKKVIYCTNKA